MIDDGRMVKDGGGAWEELSGVEVVGPRDFAGKYELLVLDDQSVRWTVPCVPLRAGIRRMEEG